MQFSRQASPKRRKLLLGVTGHPPKIGSLKQIKVTQDEVLTIKVVDHPRRDEPAEAIEV